MHYYNKYNELGALHHDWYFKKKIPWYREIVDVCINRAVGRTALDLGCGDGLVSKLLLQKGFLVTGIDNNKKGLKLAKELAPKGDYIVADLDNYSSAWVYDYMICLNVIEHIENPKNIVEIFRNSILSKGIIITDKKIEGQGIRRHHHQEFNIKELKELFKDFICKEIELKTPLFIALEVTKK